MKTKYILEKLGVNQYVWIKRPDCWQVRWTHAPMWSHWKKTGKTGQTCKDPRTLQPIGSAKSEFSDLSPEELFLLVL